MAARPRSTSGMEGPSCGWGRSRLASSPVAAPAVMHAWDREVLDLRPGEYRWLRGGAMAQLWDRARWYRSRRCREALESWAQGLRAGGPGRGIRCRYGGLMARVGVLGFSRNVLGERPGVVTGWSAVTLLMMNVSVSPHAARSKQAC